MPRYAAMPGRLAAVLLFLGIGTLACWAQQPSVNKANESGGSGDPTKMREMRKIKFNARDLPWPKVFRWLTMETGKPIISNYTKDLTGSFTIRVPDGATYSLIETIDLLNESLIEQGYILLHRPQSFTLISAEPKAGSDFCTTIPVKELDQCARAEVVRVEFPLKNISAGDLQPHVKQMLSKFGELYVIGFTNALIIQDTVRNLRKIYLVIQELEAGGGFLVDNKGDSIKSPGNLADVRLLPWVAGSRHTSHTWTMPAMSETAIVF